MNIDRRRLALPALALAGGVAEADAVSFGAII